MKKIFILIITIFIAGHTYGQGLYLKFGGGYAVPMGSQGLMEPSETNQIVGNATVVTTKTTSVKGSYGAGIVMHGAIGYKFSPFIGIDLNLSYQLGKEYEGKSTVQSGASEAALTETKKSKGFFVAPTVMFMAGTENVRPYAMVGIITGSVKLDHVSSVTYDIRDLPTTAKLVEETKGDLAFGFRGGIGVDFNLNSKLSLYAEGVFNSISYYPTESEIVEATIDGDDYLPELDVIEKRTVFVDEISVTVVDGNTITNPDEPTQELRKPLPLSSLSLSVGLKIKLGSD